MIDHVGAEFRCQMPFRDCHADRVAEPLAKRSRGGLDAGRMIVFGMSCGERAKLAETLDLLDRHPFIAEQEKKRVEQHRAMAGREHETVTIGPVRIGRIKFQKSGEQDGGDVGRPHGQAGGTALRLLDRVHGERPNGVCHTVMDGAAYRRGYLGTMPSLLCSSELVRCSHETWLKWQDAPRGGPRRPDLGATPPSKAED